MGLERLSGLLKTLQGLNLFNNVIQLLTTVLKLCVAISTVPYGISYSLPEPRGYVPVVICNECHLRQEEVGCKGWGDHQDSHMVSVQVTGLQNDPFSCSTPLLALLLKRMGLQLLASGALLQVSIKRRQDKPSYLYRSSDIFVRNLSLSKQLLALMPSTLSRTYYYSFKEWKY